MKLVEKKYLLPFILITSLFALWGFANDITNPMVAAFQTVMEISATRASLIQFAFYGGYATMAIPAALFIRRFSYKKGILLGLALYAIGAFLFIPAAAFQQFSIRAIARSPQMPPTYITPGIPRLRFPDFSVIISPVQPYRRGIPCPIALGINARNPNIVFPPYFPVNLYQ